MTPIAWAVQLPDGRIDCELVGTQREVEWWCSTDEGRAAGRHPAALFLSAAVPADAVIEVLAQNRRTDGRREWSSVGAWLHPGQSIAVLTEDPAFVQTAPTGGTT